MSDLTVKAKELGISEIEVQTLFKGLTPALQEREVLFKEYDEVKDLEVTAENIEVFRSLRLAIMRNRTQGLGAWRKVSKEYHLRIGQLIDAKYNLEALENTQREEFLLKGEKFEELQEKKRLADLQKERLALITPYIKPEEVVDFGAMIEDVWTGYFTFKKDEFEKAKQKRIDDERLRLENIKLDKLAEERRFEIAPYAQFNKGNEDLRTLSDKDYLELLSALRTAKKEYEAEQEKQRIELDRLKKESEEKEAKRLAEKKKDKIGIDRQSTLAKIDVHLSFNKCRELTDKKWDNLFEKEYKSYEIAQEKIAYDKEKAIEKAKQEEYERAVRRERNETAKARQEMLFEIGVNSDFDILKEMNTANWKVLYDKEFNAHKAKQKADAEAKKKAELEAKKEAERLAKERQEREQIQAELEARKELERKQQAQAKADQEAKDAEALRLRKAPIKEKLNLWVDNFQIESVDVDNEATKIIEIKFDAFKAWAKTQVKNI